MNTETKNNLLELAIKAPNIDNAQPFYFRWGR